MPCFPGAYLRSLFERNRLQFSALFFRCLPAVLILRVQAVSDVLKRTPVKPFVKFILMDSWAKGGYNGQPDKRDYFQDTEI